MDKISVLKSLLPYCVKYFSLIKINALDIEITSLELKVLKITKSEAEKLLKEYGFTISD
jgi:hypothetical protein